MEVEEVQSRSASVVHRNGQNMSAAQTIAAIPGSIAFFFGRRAQTAFVPPGAEAFTPGRRYSSHRDCCCGPHNSTGTGTRRCIVPATAPDAEALTAELLVCSEPECEKQPCIAESGQTTTGKPKFCFLHSTSGDIDAWSVAAKTCNRCYHTRCYHTPVCLEYGSKTRLKPLLLPPMLSHPYGIPPGGGE